MWSTELGAFLQPDQYAFLSRGGTLWSWPRQNPLRWRDPSGREPTAGDWFYAHSEQMIDGALAVSGAALTVATFGAAWEVGLALGEGRLAVAAAVRLGAVGAVKGALFAGAVEAGRQLVANTKCNSSLNLGNIGAAAFDGAVAGAVLGARGGISTLVGSGPRGSVEVSARAKSANYVKNFKGPKPVDFIFDTDKHVFRMGNLADGHEHLAGYSKTAVGGTIWREDGVLRTNEHSGHLGHLWTPAIRAHFVRFMAEYGIDVTHTATW